MAKRKTNRNSPSAGPSRRSPYPGTGSAKRKTNRNSPSAGLTPEADHLDNRAVQPSQPGLVSREEASQLLAKGYPDDSDLLRFPLGELLKSIPDVDPRYGRQQNGAVGHIHRVVDGVNILLSDHPERVVKQWEKDKPFNDATKFEIAFKEMFPADQSLHALCRFSSKEEREAFFRLLALYHDIGKAIIIERHPLVGWHLLKDVFREEVEGKLFPLILGKPYDEWRNKLFAAQGNISQITNAHERRLLKIFDAVVRFHDYFGILSTGEGSLPIMVDLVDLRGVVPEDACEIFSILMIFNLADVYASVPEVLPQKVDAFCDDWRILCDTIMLSEVNGDRARFFDALRSYSQRPDATIKRLWRLMYEGAPLQWRDEITQDMVEGVFKEATLSMMYSFIQNFALFCKLDYCLGFKILLMNVAATQYHTNLSVPVSVMLTTLAELEKRYGDLCQRPDGTWRRIGFEMAGLTRKPGTHKDIAQRSVSKIGETISDLLLQPGGLGKEWAVSECTVWFMEE